jgi:hypothetical protein
MTGYSRVVLLMVAMYYMKTDPHFFVVCYAISELLDALDGHAARYFDQCQFPLFRFYHPWISIVPSWIQRLIGRKR